MGLDLGGRSAAGKDYGKDVLLANAPGNELCVLAAEIKDDDRGSIHCLSLQGLGSGARVRLVVKEAPELDEGGQPCYLKEVVGY